MNADESAADRPSAFICVHPRLTMEKLFLTCRYLKTYGQILNIWKSIRKKSRHLEVFIEAEDDMEDDSDESYFRPLIARPTVIRPQYFRNEPPDISDVHPPIFAFHSFKGGVAGSSKGYMPKPSVILSMIPHLQDRQGWKKVDNIRMQIEKAFSDFSCRQNSSGKHDDSFRHGGISIYESPFDQELLVLPKDWDGVVSLIRQSKITDEIRPLYGRDLKKRISPKQNGEVHGQTILLMLADVDMTKR